MIKYINCVFSGIDFKNNFAGPFYKFLNDDFIHYDFKYQIGLNIDHVKFNPHSECQKGGLYFCDEVNCHYYLTRNMHYLAIIEIPDDAQVYNETYKFKADKLIVKEILNFENVYDNFWINIIKNAYDPGMCFVLKYIKNQTDAICKLAVQRYGVALHYVKNQTDEICKLAIQQDYRAVAYIKNQTDEICKLAIQQDYRAVTYIKNQTDEICKLAIQQDCHAIEYINNQTDEICKLAIQQDCHAIEYINNQTDEICKLAIQQDCHAIEYINNQTDEICKLAVQQNGMVLSYVDDQTFEICLIAVRQNCDAYKCIKSNLMYWRVLCYDSMHRFIYVY
jgi:hypothetical protein